MTDGLSKIERTRLALWALSEAEARVTTPPHVHTEVMRSWDAMQLERSRGGEQSLTARAVTTQRGAIAVAKWLLVPAVAAGMAWAAVRMVSPVASTRAPSGEVSAGVSSRARVDATPDVIEGSEAPHSRAPQPVAAEPVAAGAAPPSSRALVLQPAHRAGPASQGPAAVVFVGELMGAGEHVQVVRMRVPRSVLASLGVSVAEGSETVFVDLLVGEDGVARALQVEM